MYHTHTHTHTHTHSLLDICNYHNRSDLMKLMVASLDFAHDTHSRVILSKLLTACDTSMRLYTTKHMRVLLRAKMPFFNSWGLELLIPQLYDVERQVALEAVDILDEGCEEEVGDDVIMTSLLPPSLSL